MNHIYSCGHHCAYRCPGTVRCRGICKHSDDQNLCHIYRKISNIRCTKYPNLNVSRLVLQLSLPNPMKPCVKSRMKMQLEQRRQAMLQLYLSDRQFYCLLRCALLETRRYIIYIYIYIYIVGLALESSHFETWTKWPPLCRWHFHRTNDLEWKSLYYDLNLTAIYSSESNWLLGKIGSNDSLVPNWWQAIT